MNVTQTAAAKAIARHRPVDAGFEWNCACGWVCDMSTGDYMRQEGHVIVELEKAGFLVVAP